MIQVVLVAAVDVEIMVDIGLLRELQICSQI